MFINVLCSRVAQASSSAYDEMRRYWDVNRKLKRPLSPFLTVYKWVQLTVIIIMYSFMCYFSTKKSSGRTKCPGSVRSIGHAVLHLRDQWDIIPVSLKSIGHTALDL